MAKSKRRISARQRDKAVIDVAKKLKKAGIISKQAKLHGGRFVSREVARKAIAMQHLAHLNYTSVKVPKKIAQAAKERGYEVVQGNRIIGPKSTMFRTRLKKGELTGVMPVKGGYMEEVVLPHTVFDMRSLVDQLESGIDTLKMPEEQFAFKFYGHESYRAFMNTADMLKYLRGYKSLFDLNGALKPEELTEEFQNLVILRLHPNFARSLIPTREQRKKRGRTSPTGRTTSNRRTLSERLANMHPTRAAKVREKRAAKAKEKREQLKNNPQAYEAYKEKARKRAHKSYHGE